VTAGATGVFTPPNIFYSPQLFPAGSILLLPDFLIGVDAPSPIYSGREWWKLTKPPEALILAQNAPQTVWRPGSARGAQTRWGSLQRPQTYCKTNYFCSFMC